jgi:hypothetical protein
VLTRNALDMKEKREIETEDRKKDARNKKR